jgi:hypothetical protein
MYASLHQDIRAQATDGPPVAYYDKAIYNETPF